MSTNLRNWVQSNAFVVDKSKDVKKQSFKIIFVVRRQETHDKDTSVSCVLRGARQRYICVVRSCEAHGKD
jgi:hypothetical protein